MSMIIYDDGMRIGIDASRAFVKDPTGTERYSYEVITRLLKLPEAKKHEFVLYTRNSPPAEAYPSLNLREGIGVSYEIRQISLPFFWTQIGLAWRTWMDKLDVLWVPAHTLPLLRQGFGGLGRHLKTVVTIHGIEYEWLPAYENRLQRWYLPLSTQYAVKNAGRIIAVSEFTKKQLVERLHANVEKTTVIHEGVSFKVTPFKDLKGVTFLRRYGLRSKQYILFVGTIQPRKNLERLIQAFAELTPNPSLNLREGNERGELKLVIAGKLGWGHEEVIRLAKKHGVVVTGYISEAERYIFLQNALVYVQPSITEGFGLPVLEAMAAGVPIVSSGGGALREVVGDAGLLFDPYDVVDMTKKILVAISDSSLRLVLIRKGLERIREFNWEKATRETYRVLI